MHGNTISIAVKPGGGFNCLQREKSISAIYSCIKKIRTRMLSVSNEMSHVEWNGLNSSSFLGSTARLRPWPPAQNSAKFRGGFSIIFFFTG
jgi:hypothetical protein